MVLIVEIAYNLVIIVKNSITRIIYKLTIKQMQQLTIKQKITMAKLISMTYDRKV